MKISIHGDKAKIIEGKDDIINSGGIDYYQVEVEFDETWNDLTKYAILVKKDDSTTKRINIIDNKFYINTKNSGMHYIGFLGFKLNEKGEKIYQIPTNLVSKRLIQSAGSFDEEESDVPTASEWELYINQIQEIVNFYNKLEVDNLLNKKNNKFQATEIPENPNYGDVIQYLGKDTEKFKYGHFYKYIEGVPAQVKVEKHSETITDIVVDVNIFKQTYPEAKKYTFVYNFDDMLGDYTWILSDTMSTVSFLTSGITITGTPTENDSFDVYYSYGTEEDWYEVEVETGTQFATMPTPTKALQDKIIQYVGETYKKTTIDEFENKIETIIKTGSFWKCVFDKANCTYEEDTTVNSETTGIYYIKRLGNRYLARKLPEQYQSKTRYYKRVSEELIFKWEEVEMGKTTQYSSIGSADDFPLGTVIQYTGDSGLYPKGAFLENVLIPEKYSVAEVTSETIGTYYTYDDMRDRYIEVTLPDNYVEGETYYLKDSDAYRDWKTLQVSRPKFKSFSTIGYKYDFEEISANEYNFKIYDEDTTGISNIEIVNIDNSVMTWLSNHLIEKNIYTSDGYFYIKVNTNDISDIPEIYFNYLRNEIDTGGILL